MTDADDCANDSANATIGDVIAARFGRRDLLKGLLGSTAIAAIFPAVVAAPAEAATAERFPFTEIAHGVDETHHVAPGYTADILVRWGDPILKGAPEFDPMAQSADKQRGQFGYNNDFVGFVPLPLGSATADHGLLCVNHEYVDREVMFPGIVPAGAKAADPALLTKALIEIEMAAHGNSIIEIRRPAGGKWQIVKDSPYNRRITALDTAMEITGPAAGHARLTTSADPSGRRVIGTINNCAGGISPWGTYLTCEENFDGYFMGALPEGHAEAASYKRIGVPGKRFPWGKHHARFDVAKEPNEPNRFGWVVEIDPLDPTSTPKKRTALGRFKHEACNISVTKDGTVVAYMGDDAPFDYIYRFVAARKLDPRNRAANMDLLDDGTLSVARFAADGTMTWLPLVHGQGPLTEANGFKSQGDVVINARLAGDALGATKMDRCEDFEANPKTNKVYVVLTNNERRQPEQVDAANPRPHNHFGHIIELTPPDGDHAAASFRWEILIKAGDPAVAEVGATYNPATTANGWFACPDNIAFDHQGRLWVATDQGSAWARKTKTADGLWAVETEGEGRGTSKMFYRVPVGAEMCGPWFTPDDKTLFVAVQHPAVDGAAEWEPFGKPSTFEAPATRWPDFKPDTPPRPSVVAITKTDGGVIGS